jgi:hypothetical protein
MKIMDLHMVSIDNFKPFYQIPLGSTFQMYILRPYSKYGKEEYASNFLTKDNFGGGFYHSSEQFDMAYCYCTIKPTELVIQVTHEDSSTYTR